MRKIEFFLPMKIPTVTHQEQKISIQGGRPVVYEEARLADARNKFMGYLYSYAPEERMEGAIRLTTKWLFKIRGGHKDGEYKITPPDTDNLVKLFKDCMTRTGFWKNDSQVASDIIEKFWSAIPGIYVKVEQL